MKKLFSLLKACMTDNMSLFKIKSKNQSKRTKIILPIFLFAFIFIYVLSFANMIIEPLVQVKQEYVLLSLFVCFTSIMTLIEGIYKSSGLLFNCKDDDLLLSLPIKKSTVLFIRIFKFYLFELVYNSLFLLPAIIAYANNVNVDNTYYLVSLVGVLLIPIIPIVISCIIGGIISLFSSKFKFKNIAQIIFMFVFMLCILYLSYNLETAVSNLAQNATNVNNSITKIYYPANAYIKLVTQFNLKDLLIFIGVNCSIFAFSIYCLGKVYFKINSDVKTVKKTSKNSNYKVKVNNPIKSFIKKELNRFINSPVLVINSVMGLVLFIAGCIALNIKFESVSEVLRQSFPFLTSEKIESYIPVILFGFVCVSSLLSSITSSMISLEGKSFNILKSLPVKPIKIIFAKILTAVLIMVPCLLIGDLIVFTKFNFNIVEIITIIIASIVLPFVAETIGIIVNIKYPKLDAENDTQVVKQSMSSMISVLLGMILTGITIFGLSKALSNNISIDIIILSGLGIYSLIFVLLLVYMIVKSTKEFEKINV